MKKLPILAGVAALSLGLAACGGGGGEGATGETYELRMSTQLAETSPMVEGFRAWGEAVKEATDGAVTIEVFTSAALGSDEDVIEQAIEGVAVAVLTDGGRMSNYVPDVGIIGMPYIADNYDEVKAITESDTFAAWDEDFAAEGIKILAYNWYDGPRNFYTNKEINTPEDLKGQRIRTPGAPVWAESVAALGATPVAMPWPDAYNAVQSGTIDGVEVQSTSAGPSSMYEVTTNMARTEHFQLANFIMVGTAWFDTLPQEYQDVLVEEARSAATENAKLVIETGKEFEDEMVENGLIINEPDKQPFIDAAEAAYDKLGFTELRDQIWQEIGKS
jgi:TRAP-type transport system periplasmic protein